MQKDPQTNEYHIEKRTKLDKLREQQDIDDIPLEDFKIDQIEREDQKHNIHDSSEYKKQQTEKEKN